MPVATVFENLEAGAGIVWPRHPKAALRGGLPAIMSQRRENSAGTRFPTAICRTPRRPRGVEVLTTDKNIRYRQNLTGRKISIVVPGNSQWPVVRLHLDIPARARAIAEARRPCRGGRRIANPPQV